MATSKMLCMFMIWGHELPAAPGTPQKALHDPESEYFGIMSYSSYDLFAFKGQMNPFKGPHTRS
jgi:hypothetical protein